MLREMFTVWQEAASRSPVRVLARVKGGGGKTCVGEREETKMCARKGEAGFERVMR